MKKAMDKILIETLSKADLSELLELSYALVCCKDMESFREHVLWVRKFIHFDNAVCASGSVQKVLEETEASFDLFDISYPDDYMDYYIENRFYSSDAALFQYLSDLAPVHWQSVEKRCGINYPESVNSPDFSMKDGWTSGSLNLGTMDVTVLYLAGPKIDHSTRAKAILGYITPFLTEAYGRVCGQQATHGPLTAKEIEVLNWLKEGKSSWEISIIQKVAKRTVDFHVTNIKLKLHASSRAQAVAIALHQGLIFF